MHKLSFNFRPALPLLLCAAASWAQSPGRPPAGRSTKAPATEPVAAPTTAPAAAPGGAPRGGVPNLASAPSLYKGQPLPPDGEILEIPTGTVERFTIAPLRLVAEPYSTRVEVATVELRTDGEVSAGLPEVFTMSAVSQGEATIVLPLMDPRTGAVSERRLTVLAVDQLSPALRKHIEQQIRRVYPSASVSLIVANGKTVLLQGYVDQATDVQQIENFVRNALNGGGPSAGAAQGGAAGGSGGSQVQVVNALRSVGAQQVQLNVVFASVNRSRLRQMGVNWNYTNLGGGLIKTLGFTGGTIAANNVPLTLSSSGKFQLDTILGALQTNSLGKILSQPTVMLMSGSPAFIGSGLSYPVVTSGIGVGGGGGAGATTATVQFIPIGTNLRVVATVLGNGRIRLEIRPEVSDLQDTVPTPGGGVAPILNSRVVETTVELESGQTMVLGGLVRQIITANTSRLPGLGTLPFVGFAFSTKTYSTVEEEVIIMATPQFADALDERPCKLPGRESRMPNDVELFLGSKIEPPCFEDAYAGEWKKGWTPPLLTNPGPYDNFGKPAPHFVNPARAVSRALTPTAPTSTGWIKQPGLPVNLPTMPGPTTMAVPTLEPLAVPQNTAATPALVAPNLSAPNVMPTMPAPTVPVPATESAPPAAATPAPLVPPSLTPPASAAKGKMELPKPMPAKGSTQAEDDGGRMQLPMLPETAPVRRTGTPLGAAVRNAESSSMSLVEALDRGLPSNAGNWQKVKPAAASEAPAAPVTADAGGWTSRK